MQWHQLDHMQTICTLLRTDNQTNTPSLNFYRPDTLPDTKPTASQHWRHFLPSEHVVILSVSLSRPFKKLTTKTENLWTRSQDRDQDLSLIKWSALEFWFLDLEITTLQFIWRLKKGWCQWMIFSSWASMLLLGWLTGRESGLLKPALFFWQDSFFDQLEEENYCTWNDVCITVSIACTNKSNWVLVNILDDILCVDRELQVIWQVSRLVGIWSSAVRNDGRQS